MGLNPIQHAAALRLLRRMCGMIAHPQAADVFKGKSTKDISKILKAVKTLSDICGLTAKEVVDMGAIAARDLVVLKRSDGTYVFELNEDRAQ